MDIKHRITVNTKQKRFISKINDMELDFTLIELPGNGGNLITILIFESDSNWNDVVKLVKQYEKFEIYGEGDLYETVFNENEIHNAMWLRMISSFEQGYPQPKPHWPIKQLSYENVCPKCAVHVQTKNMRLAKEPSLRKHSFMSLIWAGEIFCKPEVFLGLEEIHAQGYESWDALIHKTNQPSERIKQLYIPTLASSGVIFENEHVRKQCPVCGITKYYPHLKGKMRIKRDALLTKTDFFLTQEWFGHGLLAWREILVSNRVARLILDKGWTGVRFKVVEIV